MLIRKPTWVGGGGGAVKTDKVRVGSFGHFFSRLSFLYSFSLSLGDGPI